jgi:hypothetical protein
MNRYCLPSSTALLNATVEAFANNFYNTYNVDTFTNYISDLVSVWYVMAISAGVAFVLGFVYMFLLKFCAGVIMFLSLVLIFVIIAGGGVWAYFTKNNYNVDDKNYKYLEYGGYILWGIAGAYLLLVLCMCNRIRLGVSIVKCTADFVNGTPQVFLVPITFSILIGGFVTYWVYTAVYIFSVGNIGPRAAPLEFVTAMSWTT